MFHALAQAEKEIKGGVDGTLTDLLSVANFTSSKKFANFFEFKGTLPPEYYFRRIILDDEIDHLDSLILGLQISAIISAVIITLCILILLIILLCVCSTKMLLQHVDELEEKQLAAIESAREQGEKKEKSDEV